MLTMYSTSWCGYCHRLKSQLDRDGIAHQVIDIEDDLAAAEYVMSVNGGNQTVPTVRFPDGSALTNPTIIQVRQHLADRAPALADRAPALAAGQHPVDAAAVPAGQDLSGPHGDGQRGPAGGFWHRLLGRRSRQQPARP